jgi:hypothetical protein
MEVKVRTCTCHDDPPYILVDDMQRGDARAFRITVAEVIQALAMPPVPDAAIQLRQYMGHPSKEIPRKPDHVGVICNDNVGIICM